MTINRDLRRQQAERHAWNHAAAYVATRIFLVVGLGLMALEAIYLLARI